MLGRVHVAMRVVAIIDVDERMGMCRHDITRHTRLDTKHGQVTGHERHDTTLALYDRETTRG